MSEQLSLSIIVPFYNAKNSIKTCLDGLLKQDFKKLFEVIMIDDASKDNSKEIIKRYKSLNIHLHVLDTNSGPAAARNVGILNSKGKYLYFLDVDDEIDDENFNILFDVIKEDDYDLVFSDKKWIENSKNLRNNIFDYTADRTFYIKDLDEIMWTRFNDPMSAGKIFGLTGRLMKRSLIEEHNILFNEKLRYLEDDAFVWDFLAYVKKARYIRKQLYYYNIHPNLNTGSSDGIRRGFPISNFKLLKDHIKKSLQIRKFSKVDTKKISDQGFIFLLIGGLISYSRSILQNKVDFDEGIKHLRLIIKNTLLDEDVLDAIKSYKRSKDESFLIPLAIKLRSSKLLEFASIKRAKELAKIRTKS